MTSEVSNALGVAPSLQIIEVANSYPIPQWIKRGFITAIGRSQTLQEIRVFGQRWREEIEAAMRVEKVSDNTMQLFKFIETEEDRR